MIAEGLAGEFAEVRAVRMEQAGRGRALRAIWSASEAQVLAYMDVDLSTDLNALLPLVAPLVSGHSDLAIGRTRPATGGWPRPAHFKKETIGGETVYDLTQPLSGTA